MNNHIFISYRRDDSRGTAGRIYDHLATHFGRDQIFMDVDTIQPGLDFVDAIQSAVSKSDLLIAVIGPTWLSAKDADGNLRLDNPEDFVRLEIVTALERNIRVIPVLVEGATPPRSIDLPENLKLLARRNAIEISHNRFTSDVQRLVSAIELALGEDEEKYIKERELNETRETNNVLIKTKENAVLSPPIELPWWERILTNGWFGIGLPVFLLVYFSVGFVATTCANPDTVIISIIVGFPITVFLLFVRPQNLWDTWICKLMETSIATN